MYQLLFDESTILRSNLLGVENFYLDIPAKFHRLVSWVSTAQV